MRLFFLAMCLVGGAAVAQQAEVLVFNEKIHDFGDIREADGDADVTFTFTNNSGRTITILSVQPSCGCTTPGWTKEPIGPGKEGVIKASFNPKGRPGYFNKTLSVTTDLDRTPIVLQIKGQVLTPDMERDETRLTAASGSFRLKSNSVNLGKVFINRPPTPVEVAIRNVSDKPVTILSALTPTYLKVNAPQVVQPGQLASIQFLLDAKAKNQYGFISEGVELLTDDEQLPRKPLSVYASIEEYFPAVPENEKSKVPVLKLESDKIEFKAVQFGATVQREFVLSNPGKQELIIRAVQPNCACITTSMKSTKIKPGGEEKLVVNYRGEGRKGTQNKAITVYSTDPQNPVQRISILAVVN